MKKKIVFLTGAGISAESGVKTFRDAGGLWEVVDIMEIASPQGWKRNKEQVLKFYNARRAQLDEVVPNPAHTIIGELEKDYDVTVVTQNVDDLHERGGSTKVIHLHGELKKMCSSLNKNLTLPYESEIKIGDKHPDGSQLRPFIVWFGENVPLLSTAQDVIHQADILVVVGTSLQVYPAASLVDYTKRDCQRFYIDLNPGKIDSKDDFTVIKKTATEGMDILRGMLSILDFEE